MIDHTLAANIGRVDENVFDHFRFKQLSLRVLLAREIIICQVWDTSLQIPRMASLIEENFGFLNKTFNVQGKQSNVNITPFSGNVILFMLAYATKFECFGEHQPRFFGLLNIHGNMMYTVIGSLLCLIQNGEPTYKKRPIAQH